jgi:hypothetical protein
MPNAGKLNYYALGQPTTLISEPSYTGTFTQVLERGLSEAIFFTKEMLNFDRETLI